MLVVALVDLCKYLQLQQALAVTVVAEVTQAQQTEKLMVLQILVVEHLV